MTKTEKTLLLSLLAVALISLTLTITSYINRNTVYIPQPGGTYHEAAVGQPRYINPILASANDLDADIANLIYSGLFYFNEDLELNPNLATDYEISEDQKQYTVKLREGVSWHDGQPFTANDIIFTIRSIQTPDYGSPLLNTFQSVNVEKIDDFTVRFTLPQPYAPFLTTLTVGIVPEHVWSAIEPKNASLAEQMLKPVGTGPYKFSELTNRRKTGDITEYKLVKYKDYHLDKPFIDEIIFTFYTSHEEAANALLTSKANGVGFLPLQLIDNFQDKKNINIHRLLLPQYFAIFFNQQKNEALNEAGVRSALALAIDREALVSKALMSQGEALHLPIPPGIINYDGDFTPPPPQIKSAQQNLSESGWKDTNEDGIREKNGKKLYIKLTTTDWPEYIATAELIKEQWSEIGVEVELEHLGAGIIQQTAVQPRNYEALLFGEILPADPDPYPFWHSTQTRSSGLNLALLRNDKVDKLLEEARQITDIDKRREKYQSFQDKILELTPAIILYRPHYLFATKKVYGVDAHYAELPSSRFNNISQWHVNRKRVWQN